LHAVLEGFQGFPWRMSRWRKFWLPNKIGSASVGVVPWFFAFSASDLIFTIKGEMLFRKATGAGQNS
jgi:hypothetical protein